MIYFLAFSILIKLVSGYPENITKRRFAIIEKLTFENMRFALSERPLGTSFSLTLNSSLAQTKVKKTWQ